MNALLLLLMVSAVTYGKYLAEHVEKLTLDIPVGARSTDVTLVFNSKKAVVGWNEFQDDSKKDHIHITTLNKDTLQRVGNDVTLSEKGDLEYLVLHEDNTFVILRHDPTPGTDDGGTLWIEKHAANGQRTWQWQIFPREETKGSYTGFGETAVEWVPNGPDGKGIYVVFYKRRMLYGDSNGVRHVMDHTVWIDEDGKYVKDIGQHCSHSLQLDVQVHPDWSQGYLQYCLGDAYPKAVTVKHFFPDNKKTTSWSYSVPGNAAGSSVGAVGNILSFEDHWLLAMGICREQKTEWGDCTTTDLAVVKFELDKEGALQETGFRWVTSNKDCSIDKSIFMERYDDRDILVKYSITCKDGSKDYFSLLDHDMKVVVSKEDVTGIIASNNGEGNGRYMERMSNGDLAWATLITADDNMKIPKSADKITIFKITRPDFTCPDDKNNCYDKTSCQYRFGKIECHCPVGFKGDGVTCDDVRCASHNDNCAPNGVCIDVTDDPLHHQNGGFKCECNKGQLGDPYKLCYEVPSDISSPIVFDTPMSEYSHYGDKTIQFKKDDGDLNNNVIGGMSGLMPRLGEDNIGKGQKWQKLPFNGNLCDLGLEYWHAVPVYFAVYSPIDQNVKLNMDMNLGEFVVWVDHVEVYTMPKDKMNQGPQQKTVKLTTGWHDIAMYFYKSGNGCKAKFWFTQTNQKTDYPWIAYAPEKPLRDECTLKEDNCGDGGATCKDLPTLFKCEPKEGTLIVPEKPVTGDFVHWDVLTAGGPSIDADEFGDYGGEANLAPRKDEEMKAKKWIVAQPAAGGNMMLSGNWHSDLWGFVVYSGVEQKNVKLQIATSGGVTGKFWLNGASVFDAKDATKDVTVTLKEGWNQVIVKCYDEFNGRSCKMTFMSGIGLGLGYEKPLVDECASADTFECHADAECKDTPSSYDCKCKDGFNGDGKTECVEIEGKKFSGGFIMDMLVNGDAGKTAGGDTLYDDIKQMKYPFTGDKDKEVAWIKGSVALGEDWSNKYNTGNWASKWLAIAIYSPYDQTPKIDLYFRNQGRLYLDGKLAMDYTYDGTNKGKATKSVKLTKGWHQLLMFTYINYNSRNFKISIPLTNLGWDYELPIVPWCEVVPDADKTRRTCPQRWEDAILDEMNKCRAAAAGDCKNGLTPLTWDSKLADLSSKTTQLCKGRKSSSSTRQGAAGYQFVGENFLNEAGYAETAEGARAVVKKWCAEKANYNLNKAAGTYDCNGMCVDYTQLIWEQTTQVGCAHTTCGSDKKEFWVCDFGEGGNWRGALPCELKDKLVMDTSVQQDILHGQWRESLPNARTFAVALFASVVVMAVVAAVVVARRRLRAAVVDEALVELTSAQTTEV